MTDPVSGRWMIFVARRITGASGEFLGAVVATIRTEYFDAFYKAITLQERGPANGPCGGTARFSPAIPTPKT